MTVKAREDTDAANDSVTLVHTAAGGEYAGAKSDVAVTVDDDETVSVVLSKTSLTVVEGDTAGQTYTVKLSHEPSVEVTVTVTGQDQTDLTLSGLSGTDTLTFSTTTWDDAQTVTVKAREDTDAANDSVTLVHTAAGGEYAGAKSDVAVTVDDDETVSVVLSKTSLTVVEGDTAGQTYTVKLSHVPRAVGRGDGDGDRPGPDGPYAERSERDGHPDLQHDHLGRCADGDGEGQRGHRRQERLRHPGPHGGGRRVRRGQVRSGGDGGRRRDGVGGAEQDIAYGGRGRRRARPIR